MRRFECLLYPALLVALLGFVPVVDGGGKFGWFPVWVAYPALASCLGAWDFWDVAGVAAAIVALHVGAGVGFGMWLGRLARKIEAQRADARYGAALRVAVAFQLLLGVAALAVADGDPLMQVWAMALAGYWIGVAGIVARRPLRPTRVDVGLVRWGFPVLTALAGVLAGTIWRARGSLD